MGCRDVEIACIYESEFGVAEVTVFADWIGKVSLRVLESLRLDTGTIGIREVRRGSLKLICVGRLCDVFDVVTLLVLVSRDLEMETWVLYGRAITCFSWDISGSVAAHRQTTWTVAFRAKRRESTNP